MRNLILSLLLLYVIFSCSGIIYIAHGHHQAGLVREAARVKDITAKLETQCKALIPNSPANQLNCVKESLEQYIRS